MSNDASVQDDAQHESLQQFKKNVADALPSTFTDEWIIKWLRSHNYNLKKTEDLFRAHLRMREVYELDTIVEKYVRPEVVSKYEFTSSLGIAKNGSPVRYTRFGSGDLFGFLMSLSGYEICLYCSYLVECDLQLLRRENEKSGRRVAEVTYVVDMEGFVLQRLLTLRGALDMGLDLLQLMQDHFPEMWGNIFVVNAPTYFDKAFNIFKPILRLNLLQKIRVASRDSSPALLLKYIDAEVLPAFLGGRKTDSGGDPRCSEWVKFGGPVPRSCHLRNGTTPPLTAADPGVTDVWVSARSVFNYALVVRNPDSRIRVEFRTENGGIGLKMLYREFGSDKQPDLPACDEYLDEARPSSNVLYVSPAVRMPSHTTPVDQRVRAPWPGIYIFRFDNTYSWLTARRILFRIRVARDGC